MWRTASVVTLYLGSDATISLFFSFFFLGDFDFDSYPNIP